MVQMRERGKVRRIIKMEMAVIIKEQTPGASPVAKIVLL